MKKIIVAMIICAAIMVGNSIAESVDLSIMTFNELVDLALQISNELHSRGESDNNYLYQGVYTVGEDIEEGRYLFKCEKLIENKRDHGEIYVRTPDERPQGCEMRSDEKWSARLREGSELLLIYVECSYVKLD